MNNLRAISHADDAPGAELLSYVKTNVAAGLRTPPSCSDAIAALALIGANSDSSSHD